MIAPDSNLLIYATSPTSPFHSAAKRWLEHLLSSEEPVGLPILSIYGFLRFMTNPSLNPRPATYQQAAVRVEEWLEQPQVTVIQAGPRHWRIMNDFATQISIRGAHLTDAAIAAIAIEHGAAVHTNDRDFARFPGLKWVMPLQASASR